MTKFKAGLGGIYVSCWLTIKALGGKPNMKLSDKIRIIRKARGLSQEALGDSLSRTSKDGISRQSVSDWENGKSEPKLDNIRDLVYVLNVSFDALLDESIDLNDQHVLASVLKNLNPEIKQTINRKSRYNLRVSTVSIHSFSYIFIDLILLFITVVFGVISLFCNWGVSWIFIFAIGGTLFIALLPMTIANTRMLLKGLESVAIGELNNTHLIINTRKDTYNTLYIPIDKIDNIEISNQRSKRCGDVCVKIEGRNKPLTICKIMNPHKLIEVFERLSSGDDLDDTIEII